MYTLAKAEKLIVAEWRTWSKHRGSYSYADMLEFYNWLKKDRPGLFLFRAGGVEQWQRIRGWLQSDEDIQSKLRER